MNAVAGLPRAASPLVGWLVRVSGAAAAYRLPVYCACTLLALIVTYLLGKDATWDTFNYHLYAGYNALHDRFAQDYFAAGPQSYLNPYAYVPFYLLVRLGLSSLAIGAILAVWQSVILWLTYELALVTCSSAQPRVRALIGACAVLLALLNPLLLQQLGSSCSDITTAELVLAGWLLLARMLGSARLAPLSYAAMLLGAAAALKLTNGVFVIGGAAMLLWLPLTMRRKLLFGATYFAVVGLAFALVAGPWSYRLERAFGNPFFPLFNDLFRSAQLAPQPLRLVRFIPATLSEALWRPFAMLDPASMVHSELAAPDERYALLIVLLAALLIRQAWARTRQRPQAPPAATPAANRRVVGGLVCGLGIAWALWLASSGNSRYFLPMACVTAALIATLVASLVGGSPRRWLPVIAALAGLQLWQTWMSPGVRWGALPWDRGPWVRVVAPQQASSEPALYLSMGTLSNSFLAAYFDQRAGFVNFTGQFALDETGASGAHVEALIRRFAPHLRVLTAGDLLYSDTQHLPNVSDVDGALARFGLRVNPRDCSRTTLYLSQPLGTQPALTGNVLSCGLVLDSSARSQLAAGRRTAEQILDRVEDACPQLLQPRRPVTEYRGHRWQRVYVNTDIWVWVSRGWVKLYNPVSGDGPIFVGRDSDWLAAPQRVVCGRRAGHDYIRILTSDAH